MQRKAENETKKYLTFVVIILILASTFFSYWPSLQNDFVNWDDEVHLLNNLSVRSLEWANIKDIFTQRVNDIYIPLTVLSSRQSVRQLLQAFSPRFLCLWHWRLRPQTFRLALFQQHRNWQPQLARYLGQGLLLTLIEKISGLSAS